MLGCDIVCGLVWGLCWHAAVHAERRSAGGWGKTWRGAQPWSLAGHTLGGIAVQLMIELRVMLRVRLLHAALLNEVGKPAEPLWFCKQQQNFGQRTGYVHAGVPCNAWKGQALQLVCSQRLCHLSTLRGCRRLWLLSVAGALGDAWLCQAQASGHRWCTLQVVHLQRCLLPAGGTVAAVGSCTHACRYWEL
jgi:hypothetical protein